VRFAVPPVGASRLLMPSRHWKRASPINGDHAIALRGVILANSVPHVEVHSRRPFHIGVLMDRFGTRRVILFLVWTGMAREVDDEHRILEHRIFSLLRGLDDETAAYSTTRSAVLRWRLPHISIRHPVSRAQRTR
jgi:hypothetical protein